MIVKWCLVTFEPSRSLDTRSAVSTVNSTILIDLSCLSTISPTETRANYTPGVQEFLPIFRVQPKPDLTHGWHQAAVRPPESLTDFRFGRHVLTGLLDPQEDGCDLMIIIES
jgi:hypothetical protein